MGKPVITDLSNRLQRPQRQQSLTDNVYEILRDAIVAKALPGGARISEAAVARELDVSKTPVREALLRLAGVGLVEVEEGRGARLVQPSAEAIIHHYELREALEVHASRLAAKRANAEQLETIRAAAKESADAANRGDIDGFQAADRDFHVAVVRASANPKLFQQIENVYAIVSALRQLEDTSAHDSVKCGRTHVRIADAISRQDADAAAGEASAHIQHVLSFVLRAQASGVSPQVAKL